MTVPKLKQQLRLRGLKVSGKKNELLERLIDNIQMDDDEYEKTDKSKEFYKEYGKELIDVSEYIKDESDKRVKSTVEKEEQNVENEEEDAES